MKVLFLLSLVVLAFSFVGFAAANEQEITDIEGFNATNRVPCSQVSCDYMKALVKKHFPAKYQNSMLCIAYYESSYCPHVYNGICCYGLFQINRNHLGEPDCPKTVDDLYDADANARCANRILATQGLNAWQTWSEGDCRHWTRCTV